MNAKTITLDVGKESYGQRVSVRQNDRQGIALTVCVTDAGSAVSLPSSAKCYLMARLPGGAYVRDECSVSGGNIIWSADERKFGGHGTAEAYFRIEDGTSVYSTETFVLDVQRAADDGAKLASPYDTEVDQAIAAANQATASADAATAKATAATASANSAAQSANANSAAANKAADAANKAAQQASAAAGNAKPYYFQAAEPPRAKRVDGMLWLHTNESAKTAVAKRWDANLPGKAVFPGASTMPGASTIIDEIGAWTAFTL